MKRQVQQTGIRKYFGADLVELQGEPLKVLDSLFSEYGPCVIQGCEPSVAEDGIYDIAPGLVALRTADPEGAERVMAMPFGGARGVSLPVWLVAEETVQERVYGDGKVKPVAHSYSAVVTASAPAGGVSSLKVTAQGAPRLVDVLQDAAHRFVSDADKVKWDARVSAAQLADALAAKADISGDMITVNGGTDSIPYSLPHIVKMLVAGVQYASVLNMPDGRDSSNQLKIVGQPDQEDIAFRTQEQGQWRSLWHSGNFDPAQYLSSKGGVVSGDLAFVWGKGVKADTGQYLMGHTWDNAYGECTFLGNRTGDKRLMFGSNGRITWDNQNIWHSGNFDPAGKMAIGDCFDDLNNITASGVYRIFADTVNAPMQAVGSIVLHANWDMNAAHQMCYIYSTDDVCVRYKAYGSWSAWRKLYHSGNLGPATASADGLMTAADKQKLDGVRGVVAAGRVVADGGLYYNTPGVEVKYYASGYYYEITFPAASNPVLQVTPFDCPDKGNNGPAWGKVCCVIKTLTSSSATIVMTDSANGAHIRADFCFSVISV